MKSRFTLSQFVLVLFAVLGAMAVANYDKLLPRHWTTYTAPDNTFSIELPGKPAAETTQAPGKDGRSKTIHMVTANPTDATFYSCACVDQDTTDQRPSDQILASARDGSLANIQGTLKDETKIQVDGHPGLEIQANARGNSLFDSRLILAGKRLYMISAVATAPQERDPKTAQRVMTSFKILHE